MVSYTTQVFVELQLLIVTWSITSFAFIYTVCDFTLEKRLVNEKFNYYVCEVLIMGAW